MQTNHKHKSRTHNDGENLRILPHGFTPYYFPIIFQEMSPCFVLDVFCVHFSLWHGPNWEVISIIPIFWVIFGYLTSLGDHIFTNPLFCNYSWRNNTFLLPKCIFLVTLHSKMKFYRHIQISPPFDLI